MFVRCLEDNGMYARKCVLIRHLKSVPNKVITECLISHITVKWKNQLLNTR